MFKRLASALLLRKAVHELHAIATTLDAQTQLLVRLADRYAPPLATEPAPVIRADTGVSHLDPLDAQIALEYVARTQRDTGYTPDDEEVLIYLADEKTVDLHARLIAREAELERLQERRR